MGEDIENSPLKMCKALTILPCKINLVFGYPKIEYHCRQSDQLKKCTLLFVLFFSTPSFIMHPTLKLLYIMMLIRRL